MESMKLLYWVAWLFTSILLFHSLNVYSRKKRNLPPGPLSWPLVGSFFSIGKSRHQSLTRLAKKYGPIMYMELGCRPHVIISSPELAKQVLKDHDAEFASRPQFHTFFKHVSHGFNDLVFAPYGEQWKMLRRISGMELFAPARVNHFSEVRKKELLSFTSRIEELAKSGQPFDLTTQLHEMFTNLMTGVLFGHKFYDSNTPATPEAEEYRTVWDRLIAESERVYIGDFIPLLRWIDWLNQSEKQLKRVLSSVQKFLNHVVEEHKKDFREDVPPRDFVDVMLSLSGENKLDDLNIVALLQNLLVAGTNTSRGTVEWGITKIIRNPRVQRKIHEEMDQVIGRDRTIEESDIKNLPYLQAVVKEIFRLHPIATTGLPHYNFEDVSVGGYTIPAHTTVLINIWAIHHDEGTWKDAESFWPERFLNTDHNVLGQHFDLIPFSSGRRRCVGIPLAMPHVSLTLAHLLHRFEWSAEEEGVDMREITGIATIPTKHRIVSACVRHK